jgi:hypothetical protein
MSSDTDDRIDLIVKGLEQVLRIAIQHQQVAEESIQDLNAISADLHQRVKTIEGTIQISVNQNIRSSLENSVNHVFEALLKKFEVANVNAIECAKTYQEATMTCQQIMRWAIWKVVALAGGVSVIVSIIIGLVVEGRIKQFLSENSQNISLLEKTQIDYCMDGKKKR